MFDIFPVTVNLSVIHFIATTVILLVLLISAAKKWTEREKRADEVMNRQWGLQGYVNGEGRFISRVNDDNVNK